MIARRWQSTKAKIMMSPLIPVVFCLLAIACVTYKPSPSRAFAVSLPRSLCRLSWWSMAMRESFRKQGSLWSTLVLCFSTATVLNFHHKRRDFHSSNSTCTVLQDARNDIQITGRRGICYMSWKWICTMWDVQLVASCTLTHSSSIIVIPHLPLYRTHILACE